VSNFMGIAIAVAATMTFFFADEKAVKIWLSICLAGDVVVIATSIFWDKAISATAQQEEYVRFDTTLTKAQAYEAVGLTEKEIEVADLLLEGLSLREIANKLFISENTAKTHRSSIYKKMQVSSKEEFVERINHTVV
ncbi:MAG: helix-turn-helix transcriptional regulator, partial [Clostridia bacterium]|nr:helix-turn-helix transcriptional regulator [Clostridia bacterium]